MDRNTLLKTKPLPAEESEEEETDSSDEEETEDEEQAEELSAYESDSDESTDATKKRQQGAANGKQQVLICAHLLLGCLRRPLTSICSETCGQGSRVAVDCCFLCAHLDPCLITQLCAYRKVMYSPSCKAFRWKTNLIFNLKAGGNSYKKDPRKQREEGERGRAANKEEET